MKEHLLLSQTFTSLRDYRTTRGDALARARRSRPEDIITALHDSHLRGRGGAGFPTGRKWETLFQNKSAKKYVVVNGAEGEPGTFKDRMVARKCPYALIEGALIAAHVLQTKDIYIALKKSFQKEIERVVAAVAEFEAADELNNVKINIVAGPEDYLFGEEKALLNVIEGIGPFPREAHLPPYEFGLFTTTGETNPALVSNIETYARVPAIVLHGAESFRSIGTEDTTGPIICTVLGDVKRPGVYEVEPGIALLELLSSHAQGPVRGMEYKAVLSGVSNGVLTRNNLHAKLEFKDLSLHGSGLGSAGFMVYDEGRSIPRLTQEIAKFLYRESCNQCTPCKTGLGNCSIHIDGLFVDNRDKTLIDRAILEAKSAPSGNRCYLPVEGSIIIPSLLKTFKSEFLHSHEPFHLYKREILPLIIDFDEDQNMFLLDEEPILEDRPYSKREPLNPYIIDRGTF